MRPVRPEAKFLLLPPVSWLHYSSAVVTSQALRSTDPLPAGTECQSSPVSFAHLSGKPRDHSLPAATQPLIFHPVTSDYDVDSLIFSLICRQVSSRRSDPVNGTGPSALDRVSCFFCHGIDMVDPSRATYRKPRSYQHLLVRSSVLLYYSLYDASYFSVRYWASKCFAFVLRQDSSQSTEAIADLPRRTGPAIPRGVSLSLGWYKSFRPSK